MSLLGGAFRIYTQPYFFSGSQNTIAISAKLYKGIEDNMTAVSDYFTDFFLTVGGGKYMISSYPRRASKRPLQAVPEIYFPIVE